MARHFRRLSLWFLAVIAALALLALCALAALWWFVDPDDYRQQIQARASDALGREVRLTGKLQWQLGSRVFIASDGGEIANAPGFGPEPLVRWSRVKLGVALRPLLKKRVLIDRIDIDGLQLRLARNAQGMDNWQFQFAGGTADPDASPLVLRIGELNLDHGDVRYVDAGTGADWHVDELSLHARLPEDLAADEREFRAITLAGRVAGGPPAQGGVRFSVRSDALRLSATQALLPAFDARWADARLSGGGTVKLGGAPDISARLALQAPSLRALLATAGISPPPMQDPATLGKLQFSAALRLAEGAAAITDLSITLDDTTLTGTVSMPGIKPLALRFDLAADRIELDRYLEPAEVEGEPFELPLASLKALDARGVLRIQQATVAGAAAEEVRIDVE